LNFRSPLWRPPTDVYETEDVYVARVEIAGMRDEDFTLELDGRDLLIRGVRPELPGSASLAGARAYHQMEIRFGEFSLDLELPGGVVAEGVQAIYENGFLVVTLPKARPRQIMVEELE
jgi:HSP20 family protein